MNKKKEAKFYQKEENNLIKCNLCPHNCKIDNHKTGLCQVRKNINSKLYSLNYQKVSALSIDPVEKKPLYHFYPQKKVLSFGSWGCNMSCIFCQNWQISQEKPQLKNFNAEEIIEIAINRNIDLLAYTYSEPTVFYEFMLETAQLATAKGLKNIMVSNGLIEPKPLEQLVPYLDAANIDLKAFNNDFYQEQCNANLESVKKTIKLLAKKIHLEITTLVITDLNDNLAELEALFSWLAEVNKQIPLHLSRYYPAYNLKKAPTAENKMKKAYQLAKKYLDHVYLGNLNFKKTASTFCNNCGEKLIDRNKIRFENLLKANKCPICRTELWGEF